MPLVDDGGDLLRIPDDRRDDGVPGGLRVRRRGGDERDREQREQKDDRRRIATFYRLRWGSR